MDKKLTDIVRDAARSLGLLHPDGRLQQLDSLGMIDLIVTLEEVTGVAVPAASLREESFESVESIAELLELFTED